MSASPRSLFASLALKALIAMINKERDGEAIDRSMIKKCVDVYEKMGESGGDLQVRMYIPLVGILSSRAI